MFPRLAWTYTAPQVLVKSKDSQAPPRYPDLLHQIPMGGAWRSPTTHPSFRYFAWISGVSLYLVLCVPVLTRGSMTSVHVNLDSDLFLYMCSIFSHSRHRRRFPAPKKHGVMCVTWLACHSFSLLVKYSDNLLSIIYESTWWACT